MLHSIRQMPQRVAFATPEYTHLIQSTIRRGNGNFIGVDGNNSIFS
jgi:hypothetical protein